MARIRIAEEGRDDIARVLSMIGYRCLNTAQIATRLFDLKITGVPYSASNHPLCLAVMAWTDLRRIRLVPGGIKADRDGLQLATVPMTALMWRFVCDFDLGRFQHLELAGSTPATQNGRCEYCDRVLMLCHCHTEDPQWIVDDAG